MGRVNFAVEQGFEIHAVDGNLLIAQLAGSAAPGGDTAEQDAAPIGSIYQRTDGTFYVKTANAGATSDWDPIPLILSGGYTPGSGDPTAGDTIEEAIQKLDGNNDDQDTLLGTSQGDTDLGTFTGATISDNTTVKNALQELETAYEETDQNADDLITLSGVAENSTDLGTFTGATISDNTTIKNALQELETAYEETDQNVDDLITLSGVAENATDLGTFTGAIISDNTDIKNALQELETFVENIEGGTPITASGITTAVTVDSVLVDDVHSVEWEVVAWEEATPANKRFGKVTALHNGTASADATVVDDSIHTLLKVGSNFNLQVSVDLDGAGASQAMRLRIASSTAGVAVEVRRTGVLISS